MTCAFSTCLGAPSWLLLRPQRQPHQQETIGSPSRLRKHVRGHPRQSTSILPAEVPIQYLILPRQPSVRAMTMAICHRKHCQAARLLPAPSRRRPLRLPAQPSGPTACTTINQASMIAPCTAIQGRPIRTSMVARYARDTRHKPQQPP